MLNFICFVVIDVVLISSKNDANADSIGTPRRAKAYRIFASENVTF